MASKSNKFSASNPKKPPIKFGGFGNLYKHTHSINTSTRLLRSGVYGFSCSYARKADLFFAQGEPTSHNRGNAVVPLRRCKPMPKIAVGGCGRRETMQGLGIQKKPGPLKGGRRKATQNLGPRNLRPIGQRPAGVPLVRGCPQGGGVRENPGRPILKSRIIKSLNHKCQII